MAKRSQSNFQANILHSHENSQLLDAIDRLRADGVSNYVGLPQIIVVGDQSAGKSEALNAISRVRFPSKDTLCTRFATEIVLRRSPETSTKVTITPSADRPEPKRTQLANFKSTKYVELDNLPEVIEEATAAMGLNGKDKTFSKDVLRIEICGPDKDHLTLVDLPGLIQSGTAENSGDQDVEIISSVVQQYMENPRSIILAVVSAKSDLALQSVLKRARIVDPKGTRTLGVITKPDKLDFGSRMERQYLDLIKNKHAEGFRLGWHCLRNRAYGEAKFTNEQRDEAERIFFSKGKWSMISSSSVGIAALGRRLREVLREQIIVQLPSLIKDVESGIEDCKEKLDVLGDSRSTLMEQRNYLVRQSHEFSTIIKSAVAGHYDDKFFGDAKTAEGRNRRLRAVIQDELHQFSKRMGTHGKTHRIEESPGGSPGGAASKSVHQITITRAKYLEEVQDLIKRTRGRELLGTFNPLVVAELFFQETKPWVDLVDESCETILKATQTCLNTALGWTIDANTRRGLQRFIFEEAMTKRKEALKAKIREIIKPHLPGGSAITYNHYFTENIQQASQEHERKGVDARLRAHFNVQASGVVHNRTVDIDLLTDLCSKKTEADMELYACSEAIHCAEAYYKVAMKTFIDNFAVLAVEFCLLETLPDVFTPDVVLQLDGQTVSAIASEPEHLVVEREQVVAKLSSLEAGRKQLRELSNFRSNVAVDFDSDESLNAASSDGDATDTSQLIW